MRIPAFLAAILALTLTLPVQAAEGGGSGGSVRQQQSMKRLTPEEKAVASYQKGIKHRDKAAKYELQSVDEMSDKKFAKLRKKIDKQYGRAVDDYEDAVGHYPRFYQAYSSLGYALRKLGQYEESLVAYNQSLEINPYYDEAIEYRGEAYLGLNRLDEAKGAYMELFQSERVLADQLMAAIQRWLDAPHDDINLATLTEFKSWAVERMTLSAQTLDLTGAPSPDWQPGEQ